MLKHVIRLGVMLLLIINFAVQPGFGAIVSESDHNAKTFFGTSMKDLAILYDLCGRQTLQGLMDGKIIVTDNAVNKMLEMQLADQGQTLNTEEMWVHFREGNKVDIRAKTSKWGTFEGTGTIREIRHDKETSRIKIQFKDTDWRGKGVRSWVMSKFSLGFLASFMGGSINVADDVKVYAHHNTVNVDFRESLAHSQIGKAEMLGVRFVDCVKISDGQSHEGYIELNTELDVEEKIKCLMRDILEMLI